MKAKDRLAEIIENIDIHTTEGWGFQYLTDKTKKNLVTEILKEFMTKKEHKRRVIEGNDYTNWFVGKYYIRIRKLPKERKCVLCNIADADCSCHAFNECLKIIKEK